jgi:hypothetical protein
MPRLWNLRGFGGLNLGPTSQDAETLSYYGLNLFCYIVNAGGGTRSYSEFRRPEMWALLAIAAFVRYQLKLHQNHVSYEFLFSKLMLCQRQSTVMIFQMNFTPTNYARLCEKPEETTDYKLNSMFNLSKNLQKPY